MRAFLLLALLALAVASPVAFNDQDAARVKQLIQAQQSTTGFFDNAQSAYHAVKSLQLLGGKFENNKVVCTSLTKNLKASTDVVSTSYSINALVLSGCEFTLTAPLKQQIQAGLSSTKLAEISVATDAAFALIDSKAAQLSDFTWKNAIAHLLILAENDGSFRGSLETEESSAVNAGLALRSLGLILTRFPDLRTANNEHIKSIVANVPALIALGVDGVNVDFTRGSSLSSVSAASIVLDGLNTFSSALPKPIDNLAASYATIANFLAANKHANDLPSISHLLTALTTLTTNTIHIPLFLSTVDPTASTDLSRFSLRVTNIRNQPIPSSDAVKVVLSSVTSTLEKSKVVASNVALSAHKDIFSNPSALPTKPGLYQLTAELTPANNHAIYRPTKAIFHSKVSTSFQSASIDFTIAPKGGVQKATYPKPLAAQPATAVVDQTNVLVGKLKLTLAASEVVPAQVFLKLSKAGQDAFFVMTAVAGESGVFAVKVNLGEMQVFTALFGSGSYSVDVLIGDALLPAVTRWRLTTLSITFSDPSPPVSADFFAPRPLIAHSFGTVEEHPFGVLSLVFSVLAFVPLLGLVLAFFRSDVSLQLPSNASDYLHNLLFQLSLVAIVLLNILYWIRLNIFEAAGGLVVVGAVAVVFGNRVLKERLQRRLAAGKKVE